MQENMQMNDSRNEACMLFLRTASHRFAAAMFFLAAFLLTGCGRREIVVERMDSIPAAEESSRPGEQSQDTAFSGTSDETSGRADDIQEPVSDIPQASENITAFDRMTPASGETAVTADPVMDPVMYVHVCGAVASPGVYELPEGSRIYQAVEAAGGFLESADQEWCNQAQVLHDGDSLRIYTREESLELREEGKTPSLDCFGITASVSADAVRAGTLAQGVQEPVLEQTGADSSPSTAGKIDLNTASEEELMTIPGIGKTRAADILSYRRTHGRFGSTEELMQISGIGTGLYEKIKEYVTAL